MPVRTPVYRLERFKRGSYYSSGSDFRRFTTLDYNMESYVGVVGVGILSGWTMEQVDGLELQVLPGSGIIDGYFGESPYEVKQRSEMVAGEREIEIFYQEDVTPANLTPSERAIYVSIIQLYDPSFNPVGDIVNEYVKVSIPVSITVSDNTDNFVFAQFKDYPTHQPYPSLDDLSLLLAALGSPPDRSDYATWGEYQSALDIYNAKLTAINEYNWFLDPANRWTEVEFVVLSSLVSDIDRVYIGKVVARNGAVTEIDTTGVESLAGLESKITKFATEFLVNHHHGGSQPYDPPKVRLETDIRSSVLANYIESTGETVYNVLASDDSSITLGHKHTYRIDESGNGITIDQIGGTVPSHFHEISSGIVGSPEATTTTVEDHIHTIDTEVLFVWDADSRYVIYLNGEEIGDETSTNVVADSVTQKITFAQGVSVSRHTYSSSFLVFGEVFSYADKDYSSWRFFISMQNAFVSAYGDKFSQIYQSLDETVIWDRSLDDPFWFWSDALNGDPEVITFTFNDGTTSDITVYPADDNQGISIEGFSEAELQALAADALFEKDGDQFQFTPKGGNDIVVTLAALGESDEVTIEILGDTEVTGTLRPESIFYIKASKILTGQFDVERIPFISHVGRLLEPFSPFRYNIQSSDGYRYTVTPTITDSDLGHSHTMILNRDGSGATVDTLVGGSAVFYETDQNGDPILIGHYHSIDQFEVNPVEEDNLTIWLTGSNVGSEAHTHNVIEPVRGDNKTVYSVEEDVDGNLYVGTAEALMMIPARPSYLFVINGFNYNINSDDLFEAFSEAKNLYELETEKLFPFSEAIYGDQIATAGLALENDGDSYIVYGLPIPNETRDETIIFKQSSFKIPNFESTRIKDSEDVLDTEEILSVQFVSLISGEIVDPQEAEESGEPFKEVVLVRRDLDNTPIWSMTTRTVSGGGAEYIAPSQNIDYIVVGSDVIAKTTNLNENAQADWTDIDIPFQVGIARKIILASDGSYWVATNNGILVSRSYNNGDSFGATALPGANPDVTDILEGETGYIYTASESGIFKTGDGGKTWTKVFDTPGGFKYLSRDYSVDKSSTVSGHFHNVSVNSEGDGFLEESIGSGQNHVHQVADWTVQGTMGHTHDLVVTLYALDNNRILWKSVDSGQTWGQFGVIPSGETGRIAAAFGKVMVSNEAGVYASSNGSDWTKVIEDIVNTYDWDYDLRSVYLGANNVILNTDDAATFTTVYTFDGEPLTTIVENDVEIFFGYAYNNGSRTFHFEEPLASINDTKALVDYGRWFAQKGNWDDDSLYDVYIDYKRVLSTKHDEDRREEFGYSFEVAPSGGLVDFSASSNIASEIIAGDQSIQVDSSEGFTDGDKILIETDFVPGGPPVRQDSQSASEFEAELNEYYRNLQSIEEDATFAYVSTIAGSTINLTTRLPRDINLPATVRKIPQLNGESSVLVSIYESILSNIGNFTHDELEDSLSNFSDGRPYKFNDSYLSNLLQLTQAVRYVYPTINSEFKNALFYDFRYASPSNPTYPPITDFIDVLTSDIYSQKLYDTDFSRVVASSVNKILVGYGNFSGNLLVASDLGLFISRIEPSYEANWFFVPDFPFPVYDILIFSEKVMIATEGGVFSSFDLETWQREANIFAQYAAYSLGLRWRNEETVSVGAHTAEFESEDDSSDDDGRGIITAASGTPYDVLEVGKGIKISDAEEKSGDYIIEFIGDAGAGYGSQMIVSIRFDGDDDTKSGVTIVQAAWWEKWDGDVNTINENLSNTILVGGRGRVSYTTNTDVSALAWAEGKIAATDMIAKQFYTLTNGLALMAAPGTNIRDGDNYLMESSNIGQSWDIFKRFPAIRASVLKTELTSENNTRVLIRYTDPIDFEYGDGDLKGLEIIVASSLNDSSLFNGTVVWNEERDGLDYITIFGNEASTFTQNNRVIVRPMKVTNSLESDEGTVYFGSDQGIYYDENTVVNNFKPQGSVRAVGYDGVIQSIDVTGQIKNVVPNAVDGTTLLVCTTDRILRDGDAVGRKLYVTDTDPVEEYEVLQNNSDSVTGEVSIEVQGIIRTDLPLNVYVGRSFTIVGESSRLFSNFDLPVQVNQFAGGTLYVSSNELGNFGTAYNIVDNGVDYVDLDVGLVPASTAVGATPASDTLIDGQSFKLVDSTGNITIWVSLDRSFSTNSLRGLQVVYELPVDTSGANNPRVVREITDINILSSTENSIVYESENLVPQLDNFESRASSAGIDSDQLNDLAPIFLFRPGDLIRLDGAVFQPVSGFANKKTTTDSGHYHEVDMVDTFVSGRIDSFVDDNTSFVKFTVSDTQNFDLPIVQLQGDLFYNAKITFTNEDSFNLIYESDVIEHDATSITVRLKSSSFWNFESPDRLNISEGWHWSIDARSYGYTDGIIYDNFVIKNVGVTAQLDRGDVDVKLENTTGISVGDKIRLQDDTLSFEINNVASIVDAENITVSTPLSRTYFLTRNPQARILRDEFVNTHVHQIRANEVQSLRIEAYRDRGYPSSHAHTVLPLISQVNQLLNRDGEILAMGSDSRIYGSFNNGQTWVETTDLNFFTDGDVQIEGILSATLNNGGIIAGTTNGRIFVEGISSGDVVRLLPPSIT